MKTCIKHQVRIAAFAVAALVAGTASSTEFVANGDFSQVMVDWSVADAHGSWIPYEHPGETVSLQPPTQGPGTLISQTLNIEGIASQTVGVSIDLGGDWGQPEGNGIAVYLEYIDSVGIRQRVEVLNPDNSTVPDGILATYSTSYAFPADAVRLVAVAIDKVGEEWMRADNISVTSPTLSTGPVPHLQSISPTGIAYGGVLAITGSNFGSVPGIVSIGATTNGVTVQSWTSGLIEVLIGTACAGGNVQVDALGPRTMEKRNLAITSPHFAVATSPETTIALAGQTIQIDVQTAFKSGLSTATGIALDVLEAPASGTFSPNPVMGNGGSLLAFDTTGLAPGLHTFTVRGQETNSPDRSAEFTVDIHAVASFGCTVGGVPLDGYTFTAQAPITATTAITNTLGNDITTDIPKPTWVSDTPGVIEVFQETSPWGELHLLPHATGTATISATLPNGSSHTFAVSVAIPADPSFTDHSFFEPMTSNDPSLTNHLYCLASQPMSSYSYSFSDLTVVSHNSYWNGNNSSHTWVFSLAENQKPGTYMFTSGANVGGTSVSEGILLHVSNDSTTGLLKGHVATFGGDMMHGASGTLEFYEASTGDLSFTRNIWEWTADYTVPRIPPGSYKLRFVADGGLDQWFPNAASNTATAVTIAAGATIDQVNFTLAPSGDPEPDPPITTPPSYDPATGTFSFGVQTTPNSNYELRKSANLEEGSWFVLQTIWGDGGSTLVEDSDASGTTGFYRIVPTAGGGGFH